MASNKQKKYSNIWKFISKYFIKNFNVNLPINSGIFSTIGEINNAILKKGYFLNIAPSATSNPNHNKPNNGFFYELLKYSERQWCMLVSAQTYGSSEVALLFGLESFIQEYGEPNFNLNSIKLIKSWESRLQNK